MDQRKKTKWEDGEEKHPTEVEAEQQLQWLVTRICSHLPQAYYYEVHHLIASSNLQSSSCKPLQSKPGQPLMKRTKLPLLLFLSRKNNSIKYASWSFIIQSQCFILVVDLSLFLFDQEVEESVRVLKDAAKTRRIPASEVLSALSVIEKAKIDPFNFLETLGGSKSPGRTWMLIFTSQVDIVLCPFLQLLRSTEVYLSTIAFMEVWVELQDRLSRGRYFPITAVQRFDAAVSILVFIVN